MSNRIVLAMFLAAALLLSVTAHAAEPGAGVQVADGTQVRATVTAIDLPTRTVGLKAENGETTSVQVDPAIQNLDMLKVGDTVVATYVVGLAARIAKPGEDPPPAQAVVDLPEKGKPGAIVAAQQVTARLTVKAVDPKANTVTLTGPRGNTKTVAVQSPEVQAKLPSLKAGDLVDVTYTEAVRIKVERTTP